MAKKTCKRCDSKLKTKGYCSDKTCPFSDHKQTCPTGWAGHPKKDNGSNTICNCKQPLRFRVTYGKTAYVSSCGSGMLDAIERSGLSISMTGESLVLTDYDSLEEFLDDTKEHCPKFSKTNAISFLAQAKKAIDETRDSLDRIGNVMFAS